MRTEKSRETQVYYAHVYALTLRNGDVLHKTVEPEEYYGSVRAGAVEDWDGEEWIDTDGGVRVQRAHIVSYVKCGEKKRWAVYVTMEDTWTTTSGILWWKRTTTRRRDFRDLVEIAKEEPQNDNRP